MTYSKTGSIFTFLVALFFNLSALADTGVGFAWDSNALQEVAYRVDPATGASSAIGVLPGLKFVVVGSHDVDYASGVTIMVGSKGTQSPDTLFVVVPATRLIYSFRLTGLGAEQVIQKAAIRAADGAIFLLSSDRSGPGISLARVAFDAAAGTASMVSVGDIAGSAFNLDGGARFGDDKKLYILTAAEANNSLLITDTDTGATQQVALANASYSALFLCNQPGGSPRLFAFSSTRAPAANTNLVELHSNGQETVIIPGMQLPFLSGTLTCTSNVLRLITLGGADDSVRMLTSLDLNNVAAGFQSVPLAQQSLKFIGFTRGKITAASGVTVSATPGFYLFSQSAVKRCGTQLGRKNPLPKAKRASFRAVAKALAKIKRVKGRCSLR